MINLRKTIGFKLTVLLLTLLFIFQVDYLLPIGNQDIEVHERQYRLAEKDFKQGKYKEAEIKLERLLQVLDPRKEKHLVEKAEKLLEEIGTIKQLPPEKTNVIEKVVQGKKKKKKFPVLLVAAGVVIAAAGVYFLTKGSKKNRKAHIEITFSPNPVYRANDGEWHYTIYLKETNGVGVTLTRLTTANWVGGDIIDVFETDRVAPYGTLSACLLSRGYSGENENRVIYYIYGNDDNGHTNLKWSGTITLKESSSNQSSGASSSRGENKVDENSVLKMKPEPIDTHSQ